MHEPAASHKVTEGWTALSHVCLAHATAPYVLSRGIGTLAASLTHLSQQMPCSCLVPQAGRAGRQQRHQLGCRPVAGWSQHQWREPTQQTVCCQGCSAAWATGLQRLAVRGFDLGAQHHCHGCCCCRCLGPPVVETSTAYELQQQQGACMPMACQASGVKPATGNSVSHNAARLQTHALAAGHAQGSPGLQQLRLLADQRF